METGYDRNVAYVMSLLRTYVDEFSPLSSEDWKEKHFYVNLLSECTKHVEAKIEGVAMYIYKSITGEDSDKRLRFARKHLGSAQSPAESKGRGVGQGGWAEMRGEQRAPYVRGYQQARQPWVPRKAFSAPRARDICYQCQKKGHFARDCKEIM